MIFYIYSIGNDAGRIHLGNEFCGLHVCFTCRRWCWMSPLRPSLVHVCTARGWCFRWWCWMSPLQGWILRRGGGCGTSSTLSRNPYALKLKLKSIQLINFNYNFSLHFSFWKQLLDVDYYEDEDFSLLFCMGSLILFFLVQRAWALVFHWK